VVQVEGAAQTWHVTDMDGKIVEVHVPSQSIVDIQTSQEERPGASGTAGPVTGTVRANGGGGGYAHKPREGPDASGASDRTRNLCQRPPDWGTGHTHCSPITGQRLVTSACTGRNGLKAERPESVRDVRAGVYKSV
jgi:hypothetical protein